MVLMQLSCCCSCSPAVSQWRLQSARAWLCTVCSSVIARQLTFSRSSAVRKKGFALLKSPLWSIAASLILRVSRIKHLTSTFMMYSIKNTKLRFRCPPHHHACTQVWKTQLSGDEKALIIQVRCVWTWVGSVLAVIVISEDLNNCPHASMLQICSSCNSEFRNGTFLTFQPLDHHCNGRVHLTRRSWTAEPLTEGLLVGSRELCEGFLEAESKGWI